MRAEHGRKHDRNRTGGTAALSATLNAHHGNVNASFAIVGPPNPSHAGTKVTTDHGDIRLDLVSLQSCPSIPLPQADPAMQFGKAPAKSVEFDVSSQDGHIVVLVPRTFSGMLELQTRRGRIHTMPHLSGAAQTVKSSRNEVVLLIEQSQMSMGI
ncbi:hypothetical protein BV25DRAFT_1827568 [Artomyces pyxidatus]|uniref:Uncharacterized protein n=1 Tax=Artomyces pyxidatus TaxID=48021 RepID=A0ACB8SYB8_9AGAM|nr:hypothetical protein BV25DRAFT_1827568 [Artomyces pyxidatus]